MKLLILFILILTLSISCDRSKQVASPSDLLYRKWELIETKSGTENWKPVSYAWQIEFRSDGGIVYHNTTPPCCSPVRVERQKQRLKVTELYGGPGCEYVDCAPPSELRLVALTADELIVESVFGPSYPAGQYLMKYKPAQ
ncbi:hypothetical protein GCM10028803_39410 [Larkinella knui]|uniref:Lipocalin-like domain-containing protein n=1 Tax=Larkinella knui TaxID=2025310 RepID=A0A3P1CEK4_9BACT|nr:hypothetical protein [Larkinella knui]RRB11783.1 hypothetical protein EHT87_25285 [Larkinella knui]